MVVMAEKDGKISLTEQLNAIDLRQYGWYDKLSEEERKSFNMYVLMRFISTGNSEFYHLMFANECVNLHFNVLNQNPSMQHRMLQATGMGRTSHGWIAPPKKINSRNADIIDVIAPTHQHLSDDELDWLIEEMDQEELESILLDYGVEESKLKGYFKK